MEVIICKNKEVASTLAASYIAKNIGSHLIKVLGCATGATPVALYKELVVLHKKGNVSFRNIHTFNLDEYVGVPPEHPASFKGFMIANFFKQIDIPIENIHFPDGNASDIEIHCHEYEKEIRTLGGIDLQVLGIGRDGHIAFNEPSSSLASRTRIKTLTSTTIKDNKKYFKGLKTVPSHAITMGIGSIMDSKECLMLAFGEGKAAAVCKFIEGPVTAMVPASMLQLHERTKVFLDEKAASKLKLKKYYKEVFKNKPKWQVW